VKAWRTDLIAALPLVVALTALGQSGNCTRKDVSMRPDCPGAIAFFDRVHMALEHDDRQALASLINYPLRTSIDHKQTMVRNRQQFLAHFEEIFDKGVRCEVLSARENDVWGNWQGFMVGGGAIWFDGIIPRGKHPDPDAPDYWTKYPFKIKTINNDAYYPCPSK
jgi:hypothetical protein